MVFLGIVMMPFYYISRTHSVPGYLQLRFGAGASGLSAGTFAVMTILMSGVNMYAMAVVMKVVLGWNIHFSIWVSSLTVGVYVVAGGLYSAIFNEVLQFFLIWFGAFPVNSDPRIDRNRRMEWNGRPHPKQFSWSELYALVVDYCAVLADNPMGMRWTGIRVRTRSRSFDGLLDH